MRIAERLLVCLAAIVAFGLSARAQEVPNLGREPQSRPQEQLVPLKDVLKAGRDTPDLLRQIDVELRRSYLKEGDVTCVASLLGDQWKSRVVDNARPINVGSAIARSGSRPSEPISMLAASAWAGPARCPMRRC